jgi:hypothetical protein
VSKTPFTCLLQDRILVDVQSRGEMREEEYWKCPLPTRCAYSFLQREEEEEE